MRYLIFVFALGFAEQALTQTFEMPQTKFQIGECIRTWDKNISWYGKTAKIYDIIRSTRMNYFVYVIETSRLKRREYVYIELTDARSDKVKC
jgi:hypothetical protein